MVCLVAHPIADKSIHIFVQVMILYIPLKINDSSRNRYLLVLGKYMKVKNLYYFSSLGYINE